MDAKLGDRQGVVSVLASMHPTLAERYSGSTIRATQTGKAHREDDAEQAELHLNSASLFRGCSVLTMQSLNTSFCLSFSRSPLSFLCHQRLTNEYKTPSGCIHPCVPLQLMMFILC